MNSPNVLVCDIKSSVNLTEKDIEQMLLLAYWSGSSVGVGEMAHSFKTLFRHDTPGWAAV